MPQRMLKPALRQSKRWNRLGYLEQTLYLRLLMLVDDYGRYDADAELIRSECFPYGDPSGQVIHISVIEAALQAIGEKGMAEFYEHEGHRYLQLTRWQERVRSESRWPDPRKCKMLTNDSNCQQMSASTTTTTIATTTTTTPTPSPSTNSEFVDAKMNGKGKSAIELMEMAKAILGDEELVKCHKRWSDRAMNHPKELRDILLETKLAKAERRLRHSPARYAEGACKLAKI